MNPKQKQLTILIALIILLMTINYSFLDTSLQKFLSTSETAKIIRVIDGDTVSIGNQSIRMLGINTPEKGEEYSAEAKDFTQNKLLNHTINLEFGKNKYDLYHRILAYLILNGKNINKELIENGYANFYFPAGKDIHYAEFKQAWESCLNKNINLCEKSTDKCASCIQLKELNYKAQTTIFTNICDYNCDLTNWRMKDEGRKNFIFPEFILQKNKQVEIKVGNETNTDETLYWEGYTYIWTKSGDTLFLRDSEGKLVLWESY